VNLAARYEVNLSRLRWPGVALFGVGLVGTHLPEAWRLPCPLRTLAGVPCPFCDMSTSVRDACGGHVGSAVAAAPLGLVALAEAILGDLPNRAHQSPYSSIRRVARTLGGVGL
jgi:hypothetical protein